MTVFQNRVRRAYLKKRSIREMVLVTLAFLAFIAVIGLLGSADERDQQALQAMYSKDLRCRVVGSWRADDNPLLARGR